MTVEPPYVPEMLVSPVLEAREHRALLEESRLVAKRFNRINIAGPLALQAAVNGVFTLAQWQTGFRLQGSRGSCSAFAGAAALEAA